MSRAMLKSPVLHGLDNPCRATPPLRSHLPRPRYSALGLPQLLIRVDEHVFRRRQSRLLPRRGAPRNQNIDAVNRRANVSGTKKIEHQTSNNVAVAKFLI